MPNNLWSKKELILAFNLYLKIPFGKMHRSNPEVIQLAQLLGRTPGSVAMRLSNFASIDPYHRQRGVVGLAGGKKQCQPIWDEFNSNREALIFESEKIRAEKEGQTIEEKYAPILKDISSYQGETKIREVKTRVNQNVFRQMILSSYENRCIISGIDLPELLVASHIIPWSQNEKVRLNPENGLCLSSLYDRAFDRGLIGITIDHKVVLSPRLEHNVEKPYYKQFFQPLHKLQLQFNGRYKPKKEFLQFHLDEVFNL
jgi:putative restriction endonuclease